MASSSRLKLFRPYRIWFSFNALTVIFLAVASFGIIWISKTENQRLVERQLEILVKSHIEDLEGKKYRSFVEGIGSEFANLFVSIRDNGVVFQTGNVAAESVCAQSQYWQNISSSNPINIQICRPYKSPTLFLIYLLIAYVTLSVFSLKLIHRLEKTSLKGLTDLFKDLGVFPDSSQGLVGILSKIKEIRSALENAKAKEIETAKERELWKVGSQVAHDIRSPLSSMKAAMEYFSTAEFKDPQATDYLNLLELSAKRLTGIADGLLRKYKGGETQKIIFSLHQILDELVGEYQSQQSPINFIKQYSPHAIELHGDRAKLQRAIGNLMKNAVEAMGAAGTLTLKTNSENGSALLVIQDTGPGMSEEKLKKVLEGVYTEGKKEGHGIGLTVVRETVAEYGGKLSASSIEGQGTEFFIEMKLPSEEVLKSAPRETNAMEKFVLTAFEGEPVVVIDDEPSMRAQWRLVLESHGKKAILCESYEDFERQQISTKVSKTAVVDYNFDNSELTGTDIVAKLKANGFQNLYLCTAEYWKPSIQKWTSDLGVKLCPKPLPKISVEVFKCRSVEVDPLLYKEGSGEVETLPHPNPPLVKGRKYNVLVIDDDEGIRLSWQLIQKKLGIATLHSFENWEELKSSNLDLKSLDIAFVDKNIEGSQFSGAVVIGHLKSAGVQKVVLASGENEEALRKDPAFEQADFIVSEKIPSSFKTFFS